MLKRKNEEESSTVDQLNKRVALDSEQLELNDKKDDESKTAPVIGDNATHLEDEDENIEQDNTYKSKPVSNHRERSNDPTYVNFRMYCPVKEAGLIVGKGGEIINHIKEKSNTRINVSDNLRTIPERIISVRGPAEHVAKAFGLIARTILGEPEDQASSVESKQYMLKILLPHPMVGYVIGKQGAKFREIEENSAAKLKAAEQPLPFSTDRILSITGVADAIHIAAYYVAQVTLEHKEILKKHKIIYYNPANAGGQNMMNMSMIPSNNNMMIMGGINPMAMNIGMNGSAGAPVPFNNEGPNSFNRSMQPYNLQFGSMQQNPMQLLQQQSHIIGLNPPPIQQSQHAEKVQQDIFVPNDNIGSVIGKGGKNIKQIRLNSGCTYIKIEDQESGKVERKLTLTGTPQANQMAIYLINQRIEQDKERNGMK